MKSGKLTTFKRRALNTALASAVALGGVGPGISAHAASATGNATATVVTPIAISAGTNLRFGSFSTTASGQTVTINATTGARTNTGAILVPAAAGGAGTFSVTGEGVLTYAITLPTNGVVTITTGVGDATRTMAVSDFTSNPSGTGTLTAGAQTLSVGATVTTVASQVAGAYSGTYDVTVVYN